MGKKGSGDSGHGEPSALRAHAERVLAERGPSAMCEPQAEELVHDLQVHQIELELQIEELRGAQAEIEASRSRYADLYDNAPVGYLTLNEKGLVSELNLTAVRLLRTEKNLVVNKPFALFINPESQDVFYFHRQEVLQSAETHICELVLKRKDGSLFDAQLESIRVEANGAPVMRSILTDVSGRKRMEEAVSRLATIVDFSKDAIIGRSLDGTVTSWNQGAERLYGYRAAEALGQSISFLVPPGLQDDPLAILAKIRRGERIRDFETQRLRKNGTLVDVSLSISPIANSCGEIVGASTIARDITERKRGEEALRESRLQLEEAADMARIAYWEHDETVGEFTFNDAFYDLLGTTAEREGGYRMTREEYRTRFVHPDDREELGRQADILRSSDRSDTAEEYEHKAIRGDGEVIHILSRNRTIFNSEGRAVKVVGVNQDITARKRAEEMLREMTRQNSLILGSAGEGICGVDAEGKTTFVNPAAARMLGWEPEDLIGRIHHDTVHHTRADGTPYPREECPIYAAFVDGTIHQVDNEVFWRKDGTRFPVEYMSTPLRNDGGALIGAVVTFNDITERRRAEEALRTSEARFRSYIESSPLGVFVADRDGLIIDVNHAALELVGYDAETFLRMHVRELHTPEDRENGRRGLETVKQDGHFEGEFQFLRKDGSPVWVYVHATLIGDGAILGYCADITEKKHLEEQLLQAQKMEAVGTLAGGVAHDFNNILTVIMGLGNLIQMGLDPDDLHRPFIDQIVASSERAADLTQSLLAFSRKQRISLAPHSVNGVVTSTAKLLTRLLPEDIGVTVKLADEDTSSLLDVTQIGQVLVNLATNARDAMFRGGSLTITTERIRLNESFKKTHGFGRSGEYVKLSVSDTGVGMDSETMKRIFEPFFTTKEVGKGTGLGLASAYGIVKQHNGYITVSSLPFNGTTFDVYLPLVDASPREKADAVGHLTGGHETILVVEDDPTVRGMFGTVLKSRGYHVIEAVDGPEGIRVYNQHEEPINLVILDVVMPGKNGKEVLDEIARTDPQVKAIFVSGYTGDVVIDKGIQSGFVDYIQKPISVPLLLAKVREVLDREKAVGTA